MPTFPTNPLQLLQVAHDEPDETVELGRLSAERALPRVQRLIDEAPAGYRYCLRFAPPAGDGSETLFQPLGRFLLEQRRKGRLARCLPMSDGAGYFVQLAQD